MNWQDHGFVIAVKPYGETSAIVEALTRAHGRHAGYVRGATRSKQLRGILVRGNQVNLRWQARLETHLGMFHVELECAHAMRIIDDRRAIAGLNALCALVAALPERQPCQRIFDSFARLLSSLSEHDVWARFARFELDMLAELGFGLDHKDRNLLPDFLQNEHIDPSADDMREALRLTAQFLVARIYQPRGQALPSARHAFTDQL